MPYPYPFLPVKPLTSALLPATLISLEEWALISVDGIDGKTYLQGQLTCDVNTLKPTSLQPSALCNAKGKVWANLSLYAQQNEQIVLISRLNVREQLLSELKKYAVFSKVNINKVMDKKIFGFAGEECSQHLTSLYPLLPDNENQVIHIADTTLIYINQPCERYIIIMPVNDTERFCRHFEDKVSFNDSQQWKALDIEAGFPIIDLIHSEQFLPQAFNLQEINAISFTKGCYMGQEMVARAKYRGINKQKAYWLAGKTSAPVVIGDSLLLKLGDNWRKTGTILSTVQLADGLTWLQAILNSDLDDDSSLKITEDDEQPFTIQQITYQSNKDELA